MSSRPPPQDFRKQVFTSAAVGSGSLTGTSSGSGPITPTRLSHSRSGSDNNLYPPGSLNMESKDSHHRNASQGKIMATNTPRKRDDVAMTVPSSNPNGRKGSWSTASSDIGDSKESKDHRRTESESGNAAPARSRRPSVGGVPRGAVAKPAKERGPNFLATLDPERFICRPSKNAKKKKKAKAGEKTTSDQHGLSRLDLAELWRHYDKNENGMLDPNEMEELAEDIIDRVPALYKEVLRRDKPSASEAHLDEMVAADLAEISPGSKSAIVGIMSKELPSNYPQNRKIREHEFTAKWNHVAHILFARMYSTEDSGALQCIIL